VKTKRMKERRMSLKLMQKTSNGTKAESSLPNKRKRDDKDETNVKK
jgi:hypothetical protein